MVKIERINGQLPDDVIKGYGMGLHFMNIASAYISAKHHLEQQGYKGSIKLNLKFIKTI